MIIIGITGTNGAGKGTIVGYLKSKYPDLVHYSARKLIEENLDRQDLPKDRTHMILMGNALREKDGAYFVREYVKRAEDAGVKKIIIESIRTVNEINLLTSLGGILVAVDAKPELRYERVLTGRKSSTDLTSYAQFMEDELAESTSKNPSEQNLVACCKLATVCFKNNESFEDLYKELDVFFNDFPGLATAAKM